MKTLTFILLPSILLLSSICAAASLEVTLKDHFLPRFVLSESEEANQAGGHLKQYPSDSLALWLSEFNAFPVPDTTGWAVRIDNKINDTLTAPAWLYIPKSYDPRKPMPLLVSLHGGVSAADFRDESANDWHEHTVFQIAEREGWLVLFPLGRSGCTWWDKTGMANIEWLVREVKRTYNVDDDRVAMCGFSDGGSGSFHFAMLAPTEFACFFPWSGHPAVGTLVGGIQTYLPNLKARPLFASNGGMDQLYPAAKMEPLHHLALEAGAHLSVSYYDTAGHNYGYMPAEWSKMVRRFSAHGRDPYPADIYFETADLDFNSSDWIEIVSLDTARDLAEWHRDYNQKQIDDRLTIGFNPDMEYKGKGIKVAFVVADPESPAAMVGLQIGDVITQIDDVKMTGMADISKAKEGRKRGDPIKMVFKRGSKTIKGEGAYPPMREYDAFPRAFRSGVVKARRIGNRFEIETSRVKELALRLSPDLVRFDQPVQVIINGASVYAGLVSPDSQVLLNDFLVNRDRKNLCFARLNLVVPTE